jgi:hypothetical protein
VTADHHVIGGQRERLFDGLEGAPKVALQF